MRFRVTKTDPAPDDEGELFSRFLSSCIHKKHLTHDDARVLWELTVLLINRRRKENETHA